MEFFLLGYGLIIAEVFIGTLIIVAIWCKIAKMKFRFIHVLILTIIGSVITIIKREIHYRDTGYYPVETISFGAEFFILIIYLVVWSVIASKKQKIIKEINSKAVESTDTWTCPKCNFAENTNSSFRCNKCGYSLK